MVSNLLCDALKVYVFPCSLDIPSEIVPDAHQMTMRICFDEGNERRGEILVEFSTTAPRMLRG